VTGERRIVVLQGGARVAAAITALLAVLALLGWAFESPILTSIVPGLNQMAVSTAICFILSAAVVFLLARDELGQTGKQAILLCLVLLLLICAYAAARYAVAIQDAGYLLGRGLGAMSSATVLNFALFTVAGLLERKGRGDGYSGLIAAGLFVVWLCVVGYAYGVQVLYGVSWFAGMALSTALTFVVLFVGALLARPTHGWMRHITSADSGGTAARIFLPATIAIPFVVSGAITGMERMFSVDPTFAFAFVATSSSAALIAMICVVSSWMSRASAELRKVDQSLAESEGTARRIIDTALDAFIQMDERGCVTEWNPQAETLFGWQRDEAKGQLLANLIIPEAQRAAHAEGLAHFLRTGDSAILGRRVEISAMHRNGTPITVELTVTAFRRRQSFVFNGFIRDRTAKLAMESQLRQAQKMEAVGQLTGGIAHDFNNLLAVIIGSLDGLGDMIKPNSRAKVLADMALKAALRGAELTRQLLVFSRRQPLEARAFNLNERVRSTTELLRRTLGEALEVSFTPGSNLWPALADPTQFDAALTNLAINARDAMPGGGRIMIETANKTLDQQYCAEHVDVTPGNYVMLAVSDTGTGMSREILERVFEPFFTTKSEGKGTGLGLSMVYGFAKQSHGHIRIYSEPGHGTTVRLYLPRADADAPLVALDSDADDDTAIPAIILVVEDNEDVRAVAVRQLLELGYDVIEAQNAKGALEILRQDVPIDLLFTDVVMPGGMTGDGLAREARKLRPGLKTLFTSGFAHAAIQSGGAVSEIPAGSMLSKPYRKHELAQRVRDMLRPETAAS
jgi:PAS domain S-box-containing protein